MLWRFRLFGLIIMQDMGDDKRVLDAYRKALDVYPRFREVSERSRRWSKTSWGATSECLFGDGSPLHHTHPDQVVRLGPAIDQL
jgi:hypothetical protein